MVLCDGENIYERMRARNILSWHPLKIKIVRKAEAGSPNPRIAPN
jgi:hypothetical protein